MGSTAYGVNLDDSDWDMVSWCVPPKDIIFPHMAGIIQGFGRQQQKFVCYQKHHVKDQVRQYDLNCYNIVHWFHLTMDNNPNMVDSLFVPRECIVHTSIIGEMVREKRHMFLHKGSWHRYKGYAYAQMGDMKKARKKSKRADKIAEQGFDTKSAYHLVRLLDEIEQILLTGDLDLRRNREQLKAIRRGDFNADEIIDWASAKETQLERLYESSDLPYGPDEDAIKQLLLNCLEEHFGNLDSVITLENQPVVALRAIDEILQKNRNLLS
jgi:predicted nucleotidyltransferase